MSWSELGLDIFKKKKTDPDAEPDTIAGDTDELTDEESEEEEAEGKVLQPGFLNRFIKSNPSEKPDVTGEDELDDLDAIELDLEDFEVETQEPVTGDPELEINGLDDALHIADTFSESHVPPTFSGVQDKVFLMDQENSEHSEPYDPTLELSSFEPPVLELLQEYSDGNIQIDRAEVEAN
ncbi:MAG: hypothetical protein IPL92_09485, partial [Saprospiraceae bacterium]|nr:hypothetical protein [Candidatus Opimibacter iunctus]